MKSMTDLASSKAKRPSVPLVEISISYALQSVPFVLPTVARFKRRKLLINNEVARLDASNTG